MSCVGALRFVSVYRMRRPLCGRTCDDTIASTRNRSKETTCPSASARHILVETEDQAKDLKQKIEGGEDFGELAKAHSKCPSGRGGGDLGTFKQGDMVPEFDTVVFGDLPIGEVSEPVKTQFGYHLLEVQTRHD